MAESTAPVSAAEKHQQVVQLMHGVLRLMLGIESTMAIAALSGAMIHLLAFQVDNTVLTPAQEVERLGHYEKWFSEVRVILECKHGDAQATLQMLHPAVTKH